MLNHVVRTVHTYKFITSTFSLLHHLLSFSQGKEIGPEDAEFSFPEEVLMFIRHIVPGNIKGEIREVGIFVPFQLHPTLLC